LPESDPLGEQVPDEEILFRLAFFSSDGKISPEAFQLSSSDKRQNPPRLSVYAASRTTPQQAWEIINRNPRFIAVARITTSDVRKLRPSPDDPSIKPLDVRWDPLIDEHPGADGHAAIIGLDQGEKAQRRSYRVKLSDLANRKPIEHLGPPLPFHEP
jgi:hypothetical protein